MATYVDIILSAIFSENLALAYLLGMCTFLAVSRRLDTAFGLGLAVVVVLTLTTTVNQAIQMTLLAPGALAKFGAGDTDLGFLRFIVFIGVIAALVQVLDLVIDRFAPTLHARLGIYLPLLTVNCAVLGGSLLMVQRNYNFGESVAYGFGAGVGWMLALLAFAAIRERLRYSDIPAGLRGLGLAFVVAGLLSLAFSGFSGIEFSR